MANVTDKTMRNGTLVYWLTLLAIVGSAGIQPLSKNSFPFQFSLALSSSAEFPPDVVW